MSPKNRIPNGFEKEWNRWMLSEPELQQNLPRKTRKRNDFQFFLMNRTGFLFRDMDWNQNNKENER